MAVVRVYIVRHGETEENRIGVMQGHLDSKLNAAGVEQATRTAKALEHVRFAEAHSSDLSRAIKTAEIILEGQPATERPVLRPHAALRERYMGDMQGKTISAWRGPLPQDMEPAAAVAQRADEWWKSVVVRYVHSVVGRSRARERQEPNGPFAGEDEVNPEPVVPQTILVVSHGGLIRSLLQGLIGSRKVKWGDGMDADQSLFQCANASVTVIELDKSGRGTLVLCADTTHLDSELVEGNVDLVADSCDGGHSMVQ